MSAYGVVVVLLVLGVSVAIAREMRRADARTGARVMSDFVVTTLAWPFYLPSILAWSEPPPIVRPHASRRPEDQRIDRAEVTLRETLAELDGVALDALRSELPLLRGLASGLRPWAARLAALEAELARPESDRARLDATLAELKARGVRDDDPRMTSVRARRASLEHLATLHAQSEEELERALLELEELSTELRVLRFAGERPGADAIERLRQLASSVAAVRDALLAAA